MSFSELKVVSGKEKYISKAKSFCTLSSLSIEEVRKCYDFAFNMTFGNRGEHRNHRSGGTHNRKNGEIFANTFLGKLCEFAVYRQLSYKYEINEPDLSEWELGKWDACDFRIQDKSLSVKSTKYFGNLLLLELKDWSNIGGYLPNDNQQYDFTFLVRIKNDPESLMKQNRILYSDVQERENLWKIFEANGWEYDVPGYITLNELIYLINNEFIIYKGDLLNGKTPMDATNYYCQSGDMHNIESFKLED